MKRRMNNEQKKRDYNKKDYAQCRKTFVKAHR